MARMDASTRFGLIGVIGLAALSLIQWLRKSGGPWPETAAFLLGIGPNLAAAIAIPFVLLSIWAHGRGRAPDRTDTTAFALCAGIAGIGLVAWEFYQRDRGDFVFDLADIGASFVGLVWAALLFALIRRSEPDGRSPG